MTLPRPVTKDKYGKRTSDYTQYDWIGELQRQVNDKNLQRGYFEE